VNEAGRLECAYHGWEFTPAGDCVAVPQAKDKDYEGRACNSERACLETFPCAVRQGLLFVKPRALRAGEEPDFDAIPLVDEVEENPEEWVMSTVVRDMPMDYSTLLENTMDVSHVPFTHHATVSKRANACAVELTVTDKSVEGFNGVWASGPRNGYYGPQTTRFAKPGLMVHALRCYEKRGFDTLTVVYAVPVAPGKSRLISRFPFRFKSAVPRTLFKIIPEWSSHPNANTTLEDDQIFLHKGEREVLAAAKEVASGADGSVPLGRLYYMPTTADRFVTGFREWLEDYCGGGPFGTVGGGIPNELGRQQTVDELMDRFHSHTAICKSCSAAYENLSRARVALETAGILLALSAGLVAAVALTAASGGTVVTPAAAPASGFVAKAVYGAGRLLLLGLQVLAPPGLPPPLLMARAGVLFGMAAMCRAGMAAVDRYKVRFVKGEPVPPRNAEGLRKGKVAKRVTLPVGGETWRGLAKDSN